MAIKYYIVDIPTTVHLYHRNTSFNQLCMSLQTNLVSGKPCSDKLSNQCISPPCVKQKTSKNNIKMWIVLRYMVTVTLFNSLSHLSFPKKSNGNVVILTWSTSISRLRRTMGFPMRLKHYTQLFQLHSRVPSQMSIMSGVLVNMITRRHHTNI